MPFCASGRSIETTESLIERARQCGNDAVALEQALIQTVAFVELGIEAVAVIMLVAGSLEALLGMAWQVAGSAPPRAKRKVWLRYAAWIILSLEFSLAADIVRSLVAPTWDDIGKLGAIATIRTVLNFFLERDIELADRQTADAAPVSFHSAGSST